MDPLHVAGGLAKCIDHVLSDLDPITDVNFGANLALEIGENVFKPHGFRLLVCLTLLFMHFL